eukprot:2691376-Rhodomonas_salina.2
MERLVSAGRRGSCHDATGRARTHREGTWREGEREGWSKDSRGRGRCSPSRLCPLPSARHLPRPCPVTPTPVPHLSSQQRKQLGQPAIPSLKHSSLGASLGSTNRVDLRPLDLEQQREGVCAGGSGLPLPAPPPSPSPPPGSSPAPPPPPLASPSCSSQTWGRFAGHRRGGWRRGRHLCWSRLLRRSERRSLGQTAG